MRRLVEGIAGIIKSARANLRIHPVQDTWVLGSGRAFASFLKPEIAHIDVPITDMGHIVLRARVPGRGGIFMIHTQDWPMRDTPGIIIRSMSDLFTKWNDTVGIPIDLRQVRMDVFCEGAADARIVDELAGAFAHEFSKGGVPMTRAEAKEQFSFAHFTDRTGSELLKPNSALLQFSARDSERPCGILPLPPRYCRSR
jgi:hypothetical protein